MTDLERVREALENPSCVERIEGELTWREHDATAALADLDAHLKEDAEREKTRAVLVEDLNRQLAELTELREKLGRLDALGVVKEHELAELREEVREIAHVCLPTWNRLRQLIEEKP